MAVRLGLAGLARSRGSAGRFVAIGRHLVRLIGSGT